MHACDGLEVGIKTLLTCACLLGNQFDCVTVSSVGCDIEGPRWSWLLHMPYYKMVSNVQQLY